MSLAAGLMKKIAKEAVRRLTDMLRRMSEEERRGIAHQIIAAGYGYAVAQQPWLFRGIDNEVAVRLILLDLANLADPSRAPNLGGLVVRHHAAYRGIDARQVYECLRQTGQLWALGEDPEFFRGCLGAAQAKDLISRGHARFVGEHLGLFKDYGPTAFNEDVLRWFAAFKLTKAPGHRFPQD